LEAIDAKFEFREDFEPSGPRFATLGMRGGHEVFWGPLSVLSRVQKRRSAKPKRFPTDCRRTISFRLRKG